MTAIRLETDRLVLRDWQASDWIPFSALNADAETMRYFPGTLTAAASEALIVRICEHFAQHGFGFWALELKGTGEFIGFTGLSTPRFSAHFTPCVEIGWRMAKAFWGHGYATEAAQEALRFGFERLSLDEIVAFTAVGNLPSRRVMDRIGMVRDSADDFDHPGLPETHPLRPHVLYRMARAAYLRAVPERQ
jgi:RimJ/RimL family protein N-acetyltransferase